MKAKVFIMPFRSEDPLEFEWDALGPTTEEALEQVFREFNVVLEGDPHVARKCRSLSVGDVVEIGGLLWECCPAGWAPISVGTFEWIKGMTFAERSLNLMKQTYKDGPKHDRQL